MISQHKEITRQNMKNLKLSLGIIIGFIILLGCVIFVDGSIAKFIPTQPFGGMAEFAIRILLMTISYFVIKKMYKKISVLQQKTWLRAYSYMALLCGYRSS